MSEEKLTHEYEHTVQYYETDAMRIVHHSNYIRWMEEARLDFFREFGLAYDQIESMGVIIPVIGVSCEYKAATRYGEKVLIHAELRDFTGLKFSVDYRITSPDGSVLHATGSSQHCFLDTKMRPMNIKRHAPQIYAIFEPYKI
ncbi:MAG: acyl-CoA thioesterase [Lachnospiraceae bacterium]|nr:acyl-CoA thioesterase [Lachnospiraceae bacterium]